MSNALDAAGRAHYEAQNPAMGPGGPMSWDELPGKAREVLCLQVEAVIMAAAPFIAAQALRDASEFARNENDRVGICGPVFNGGFGYALRIVGELADELDPPGTPTNS